MKIKEVILFKNEKGLLADELCSLCKNRIGKEEYYFVAYDDLSTINRIHKRCAYKNEKLSKYLFIKLLEK